MPGDPRGTEPFIQQAYRFAALHFDISTACEAADCSEEQDGMTQLASIAAQRTFMCSTDGWALVHGNGPAAVEQQV